ncbi:hypothetical protein Moror_8200 [Moniliophthora roreri MCA 2997]|uniref:Uncharacterized protein n=1 Tax=Moniliophthora roreri (strain MCA 2997) TaxID=1381753 RepID=V2XP73_MONRO|nr:hypothetical protein Moror_8200 [Moniliophthora roreri MCA 2997]
MTKSGYRSIDLRTPNKGYNNPLDTIVATVPPVSEENVAKSLPPRSRQPAPSTLHRDIRHIPTFLISTYSNKDDEEHSKLLPSSFATNASTTIGGPATALMESGACICKSSSPEVAVVGKVRPSLMLPKPPTLQVDMPIQSESQGQLQRGVDSPRTEETVHIRECRRYLAFKRPSRRVLRQNQRERARRYGRDVAKLNADENRSRSAQDDNDRAP